jgi:molecular chaperone IbpA
MRNYDFAPLFRSTVGFERLFDMLDQASVRSDWPPYNIERTGESQYRVSMAIAGFDRTEIDVTQQGNTLLVTGQKKAPQGSNEMLHQGVAFRNFRQTLSLADHVKVTAANLENGLLSIELVREIPEQLKPRRIEINAPATATISAQDNRPKLSDENADRPVKAA